MKKILILSCLILFFTIAVHAQEKIETPVWNIEDKWNFKGRATMIVVNADENTYTVKSGTSIYIYDKSSLNILYSIEGDKRKEYKGGRKRLLNFPLYIGKGWGKDRFVSRATYGTTLASRENIYYETYTVLGWEDIIVEAGKFKTVKIEYRQEGIGESGRNWVGKAWYWYSPEANYFVKLAHENNPVWIGIYGWELTSFELKK